MPGSEAAAAAAHDRTGATRAVGKDRPPTCTEDGKDVRPEFEPTESSRNKTTSICRGELCMTVGLKEARSSMLMEGSEVRVVCSISAVIYPCLFFSKVSQELKENFV